MSDKKTRLASLKAKASKARQSFNAGALKKIKIKAPDFNVKIPKIKLKSPNIDTKALSERLRRMPKWVYPLAMGGTVLTFGGLVETQTGFVQSMIFNAAAENTIFSKQRNTGADSAPVVHGPYDKRHGYDRTQVIHDRLTARGFVLDGQTTWYDRNILGVSLFPIYDEKQQAGITLSDEQGRVLYDARFPRHVYQTYEDIPPVLVKSLLYVENRELLNPRVNSKNPAIEWERLFLAVQQSVTGNGGPGGSTLATQTEKFRHSPGGETSGDVIEKFRQMLTASVRSYQNGSDTTLARQDIVLNYVNGIPLSAVPGFGEVHGFSDGMRAWFGKDPNEVTRLLMFDETNLSDAQMREKALAYRETLSIVMAVKKPTAYFRRNPQELEDRIDSYLPLMVKEGIISERLSKAALNVRVTYADPSQVRKHYQRENETQKSVSSMQIDMMKLLGLTSLYDLDRYDISAKTTLDVPVDRIISQKLHDITDPQIAAQYGLTGYRLLPAGQTRNVTYTFTMYERMPDGSNVLRVQADNFKGQFNLNEDSKLELGSTAKLRTMVSYLEAISELHERYSTMGETRRNITKSVLHRDDNLTRFVLDHLSDPAADTSLEGTLEAALNRTYSGNPGERFFTGGGEMTFSNFDNKYNGSAYTVKESLQHSLNLPFVRIMRDVVNYNTYQKMQLDPEILTDPNNAERLVYLERFADKEGTIFLYRGWQELREKSTSGILDHLAEKAPKNSDSLATVYRTVLPQGTVAQMKNFIQKHCATCSDRIDYAALYTKAGNFNANERGHVTGIQPMTLWVGGYLANNPEAKWSDMKADSYDFRIESYSWLINSNKFDAQNTRIKTMIEAEAFEYIHKSWQEKGYPFDKMVPSIASALGSSGDTPAALATFAGILQNDGLLIPSVKFTEINFAENTPYQMNFRAGEKAVKRVLPSEVARIARREMQNVVENGTARRAHESIKLSDGRVLPIGGKTGTGDNRIHQKDGSSIVQNRTATFVYTIDDRFYGCITAFVDGEDAAKYAFTSGLTAQIFKSVIAPELTPVLDRAYGVQTPQLQAANAANAKPKVNFNM